MSDHPCVVDPTLTECVELAEKLAAKIPETHNLTDVIKSNAPAVMERLNAAIAHIGEWVETGEAFASEQVPLLVTEIVYWGAASQAFWVGLGACFLVVGVSIARFAFKRWAAWCERDADEDAARRIWSVVLGCFCTIMGFFMFACHVMPMLKPLVAPRLYLIEYFQQLVR